MSTIEYIYAYILISPMWIYLLPLCCVIAIYELTISHYRKIKRKQYYQIAENLSKTKNKPLIVIGDPKAGWHLGKHYKCGDLCIDLVGCKTCPNQISGKAHEILKQLSSNSSVIFISCVLEYIDKDDLNETLAEIYRVSGGDIINVAVEPYSLLNYHFYGTQRTILSSPPHGREISYIELPPIIKVIHFLARPTYYCVDMLFNRRMEGYYIG